MTISSATAASALPTGGGLGLVGVGAVVAATVTTGATTGLASTVGT